LAKGIVAFVTNNSFIDNVSFDGMRKHLAGDFSSLYLLDLGGNVRQNPKISGTTHNVFGIQVGVSINLLIRGRQRAQRVYYAAVDRDWRKEEKFDYLDGAVDVRGVAWREVIPDRKFNWLTEGLTADFDGLVALVRESERGEHIFGLYSNGVKTNRDTWAYNFNASELQGNIRHMLQTYREQLATYNAERKSGKRLENVIALDPRKISWSAGLKQHLERGTQISFVPGHVRVSLYRPFTKEFLYFDSYLTERRLQFPWILPTVEAERENQVICAPGVAGRTPYWCFCSNAITNLSFNSVDTAQCFPFYTYDEDGSNRRENITDWALEQFRSHYHDPSVTKWDIFHYIYAVLHHPEYRVRYAANLRRELPRVPFAALGTGTADKSIDPSARKRRGPQDDKVGGAVAVTSDADVFRAFARAGQRLAEIHVHYEQQPEYPLTRTEKAGEKLDYRVVKMKLSKDKASLVYNKFLTLSGIPPKTFEYRLGNRSALEWVVDQYQVSTDKRSGITNDPNRADDPQYILWLIGQVVTVSLETVKVVGSLPPLGLPD
jgi:predicted helicase